MTGSREIKWETSSLLVILTIEDQVVRLKTVRPAGIENHQSPRGNLCNDSSLPLTEIRLAGEGTSDHKSSKSLICGSVTARLKYKSHREFKNAEEQQTLEVTSYDDVTKLTVTATLVAYEGTPTLRSFTTVQNDGEADIVLCQVTSFVVGGLTAGTREWYHDYVTSSATNSWFREAQWHDYDLPTLGLDSMGIIELNQGHASSHATYSVQNHGSFSTGGSLPMGMLKKRIGGETWLWQVENNGSWRYELGDFKDDVYLALTGPTDYDHHWRKLLSPGQTFASVPCALVHVYDGIDVAFSALTTYRRHIRRKHTDNETLPVIFNDYMNCLMGDPTEEKVRSLIKPAVFAGAEYFVIDAGWYADETDWWDSVGEWEPSAKRFPSGFQKLIGEIRDAGLVPGIWLEPEVIGVRSRIASELPPEAFFQVNGKKVVEKRRYQLDYRSPVVRARMDKIVDTLVKDYGVGYFKLDYNIDVASGTDFNAFSSGAGALGHNRAYLAWIQAIFDRYPSLVIETCSSGGQRLDGAMLAVHPIQSTSDQQDPIRYAAVSAAIATAVAPEQSASWAYPQPEWTDEVNAFTVVNSLMGRVHLSGAVHKLNERQLKLVKDGMDVYKSMRGELNLSTPFWPLGLPAWHDDWLAYGLAVEGGAYVAIWRRGGPSQCSLRIGMLGGSKVEVEVLYPIGKEFEVEATWDGEKKALDVTLPDRVCARLLRLKE